VGAYSPGLAHALILAAGQGRRFGGEKLLALYRGRRLVEHVLNVVATGCECGLLQGGHVVIGAKDEEARKLCESWGLEPILNPAPELGLSHSIQLGLAALESGKGSGADAALVFLGDQPLVQLEVVEVLIAAWHAGRGTIIRPAYQGSPGIPGHPTLLDSSVWPQARRLQGDRGFAALIKSASFPTVTINVPGENPDVDTRADLHALEESSQ
jgi:CTP:molybdopterin cytidylyltransferase MocA